MPSEWCISHTGSFQLLLLFSYHNEKTTMCAMPIAKVEFNWVMSEYHSVRMARLYFPLFDLTLWQFRYMPLFKLSFNVEKFVLYVKRESERERDKNVMRYKLREMIWQSNEQCYWDVCALLPMQRSCIYRPCNQHIQHITASITIKLIAQNWVAKGKWRERER